MSSAIDLPNIINLQKQFIINRGDDLPSANQINGNLTALSSAVSSSGASILPTLTYQNDVQNVLNREQTRLSDRKNAIDAANMGQKRMVDLTKNATQRNMAINNMYITISVALILYLGIRYSSGMLPEMATDIMMILLVSITVLTLIKMNYDYNRRNNMDYDMINLGEPGLMVGKTTTSSGGTAASGAGLLDSRLGGGCIKDACCPLGTTYNEKYAICVQNKAPYDSIPSGETGSNYKYFMPDNTWKNAVSVCGANNYSTTDLSCNPQSKQPFTTMNLSTSDMAKPNEPFEFVDYNLYK
jgi:hypothetical protein